MCDSVCVYKEKETERERFIFHKFTHRIIEGSKSEIYQQVGKDFMLKFKSKSSQAGDQARVVLVQIRTVQIEGHLLVNFLCT